MAKGLPSWSVAQNVTKLSPGTQVGCAQQLTIQVVFLSEAEALCSLDRSSLSGDTAELGALIVRVGVVIAMPAAPVLS